MPVSEEMWSSQMVPGRPLERLREMLGKGRTISTSRFFLEWCGLLLPLNPNFLVTRPRNYKITHAKRVRHKQNATWSDLPAAWTVRSDRTWPRTKTPTDVLECIATCTRSYISDANDSVILHVISFFVCTAAVFFFYCDLCSLCILLFAAIWRIK